jgi:hypothetical protein
MWFSGFTAFAVNSIFIALNNYARQWLGKWKKMKNSIMAFD